MRISTSCLSFVYAGSLAVAALQAQAPALRQIGAISVEGVNGEFDHFAIDLAHRRLYLAAEDQKTVEVFDLSSNKHIDSIRLFQRPHGLIFIPGTSRLIVADGGDGTCKFIDTDPPRLATKLKTALRADAVTYDAATQTGFVANGGVVAKMDYSLVTAFNTATAQLNGEIKLESKILEAMAIEKQTSRLFINLMDKNNVTVLDRVKREILAVWPLPAEQPSAMAFDEPRQRLFVACRKPGRLVVLNTATGKPVTDLPCIGHADDAFYDPATQRIYISGGNGAVSVYKQHSADQYSLEQTVSTGSGAKTSLFVPELKQLFVAIPAGPGRTAQVLIFSTAP